MHPVGRGDCPFSFSTQFRVSVSPAGPRTLRPPSHVRSFHAAYRRRRSSRSDDHRGGPGIFGPGQGAALEHRQRHGVHDHQQQRRDPRVRKLRRRRRGLYVSARRFFFFFNYYCYA